MQSDNYFKYSSLGWFKKLADKRSEYLICINLRIIYSRLISFRIICFTSNGSNNEKILLNKNHSIRWWVLLEYMLERCWLWVNDMKVVSQQVVSLKITGCKSKALRTNKLASFKPANPWVAVIQFNPSTTNVRHHLETSQLICSDHLIIYQSW